MHRHLANQSPLACLRSLWMPPKVIFLFFLFMMSFYSTVGWRLGLQQITGLLVTTFLLGTFYRSASLYHPQRRAILHLKTQKRKIKNKDKEKNKLQDDRPPFFEFTTLKSRTVRIILFSALVSHVGIYSPLFFLVSYLHFYLHITTYSRCDTFSNTLSFPWTIYPADYFKQIHFLTN